MNTIILNEYYVIQFKFKYIKNNKATTKCTVMVILVEEDTILNNIRIVHILWAINYLIYKKAVNGKERVKRFRLFT